MRMRILWAISEWIYYVFASTCQAKGAAHRGKTFSPRLAAGGVYSMGRAKHPRRAPSGRDGARLFLPAEALRLVRRQRPVLERLHRVLPPPLRQRAQRRRV